MNQWAICCSFILYTHLLLAISISNLTMSILNYIDMKLGSELYNNPLNNWRTEVIADFEVGINCKGDNIFNYVWPGTVIGCKCRLGGAILRGKCCVDTKKKKCQQTGQTCRGQNILGEGSQTGGVWEINDVSIKICAQRISDYSLATQTPRSGACNNPSDLKCGSGEFMFCVPKTYTKCPVRSMIIGDSSDSALAKRYEEQIPITGNSTLYFSRTDNNVFPMAEFRVKQGSNICIRNSFSVGTPGRNRYFLLNYDTDPSCQLDARFISSSNMGEKRLFYLNNIDDVIQSLPPVYEVDDRYKYYSFYNNFGRLKPECRQYLQGIYDNNNLLNEIQVQAILIMMICGLAMAHTFFFDFMTGFHQGAAAMKSLKPIYGNVLIVSGSNAEGINFFYQFFVLLQYIIFLILLITLVSQKGLIDKEHTFLKDLREKQCSDQYFDDIIADVQRTINSYNVDVILGLLITLLAVDPSLGYLLGRFLCPEKNNIAKVDVINNPISTEKHQDNLNYTNLNNNSNLQINQKPHSNECDDISLIGLFDNPIGGQTASHSTSNNQSNEPSTLISPHQIKIPQENPPPPVIIPPVVEQPAKIVNPTLQDPEVNPPIIVNPTSNVLPGSQTLQTMINVQIVNQNPKSGVAPQSYSRNDPDYKKIPKQ